MKRILLIITLLLPLTLHANYKLETGSKLLAEKYNFNTYNLNKEITRKEFVETLYKWYPDYKKDRGVIVDMDKYTKLDNSKIFKDINLDSKFGVKLSFLTDRGMFAKNEYFNPSGTMSQRTFFIVMKRLKIMFGLQNCKYHKICEKESDDKTLFLKGTYYKYVSKIMDKSLRKYYSSPLSYIEAGYKPYLSINYYFPLTGQTLNGCYAFSVRNILKYKDGIGIYIPKIEKAIGKEGSSLWNYSMMDKFDDFSHIDKSMYYNIDTLISSLQAGEPVAISYMLDYYSYKEKKYKQVPHIVAAYSFDNEGIWVSETVSNQRKRVSWDRVFNSYGGVKLNRIFKYYYNSKSTWNENEVVIEKNNNYLAGEY